MKYSIIVVLFVLIIGCSDKHEKPKQFEFLNPDIHGIHFSNDLVSTDNFNVFKYRNFYNGGGVGIGDVNNDGLADIYLISNMNTNKLYLNKGEFKFEDITDKAGVGGSRAWSTGVSIVDVNADGLLDIYVTNAGYLKGDDHENELFINNGDMTFTESAAEYGLNDSGYSTHAAFFDYDLDGDLDVYILNNSFIPINSLNYSNRRDLNAEDWPIKDFVKGGGDKLLKNEGGKFTDVTKEANIYGSLIGFGLGVTVGYINNDRYPDIYVSNDFYERDYLYINQKDGSFRDEIMSYLGHISLSSMGADMADINNDGLTEIFVTEMLPETDERTKTTSSFEQYNIYQLKLERGFYHQYMHNTLQLNNGNNLFSEIAWYSGVSTTDWSWGGLMFDGDNDGFKDLFVSNGIYRDVTNQDFIDFFANEIIQEMVLTGEKEEFQRIIDKMPSNPIRNKYFRNLGNLKFEDIGEDLGFETPSFSNGSAYGDLDNDGDLDLVVNNVNQEVFIYRNNVDSTHHYLAITLEGSDQNPRAVGTTVKLFVKENIITSDLIPTRGFQSSVDYKIILGIGKNQSIDSLQTIWPNGKTQTMYAPPIDTTLVISYEEAIVEDWKAASESKRKVFSEVENSIESQKEDLYVDFFYEGMLIKMLSKEGPVMDNADVNGDGLDDIYIGGSTGQPGRLFIQKNGKLLLKENLAFDNTSKYEDTCANFFDADSDGDMDLFVGSGGNNITVGERQMSDRIYINDGSGNFQRHATSLPFNSFNSSVVIPFDIDRDGDLDLFVGSRSLPGVYGLSPQSFIYRNDGEGNFQDLTARYNSDFRKAGLITDARLTDFDNDGAPEIVMVGEWMAPRIFELDGSKLIEQSTGLDSLRGWWFSVEVMDVDNDGDQDMILGNVGENFSIKGSFEEPVKIWIKDFDGNQTIEKIVTRTIKGKDKPIFLKREFTSQLNHLKKQNLKHEDYAKRGIRELFTDSQLENVTIKKAVFFSSIVALNDGVGNFEYKRLPDEVQFSCVRDIYCRDLNNDGYLDLIMGGNDSGFQPQFSKLDASYGHILLNNTSGNFDVLPFSESGFMVKGNLTDIVEITIANEPHILVSINEKKPKLFKINQHE